MINNEASIDMTYENKLMDVKFTIKNTKMVLRMPKLATFFITNKIFIPPCFPFNKQL
jgi:hypothetical protein